MKAALQSFIDRDRENPMKYDFGTLPKVFLQKEQVHKYKDLKLKYPLDGVPQMDESNILRFRKMS